MIFALLSLFLPPLVVAGNAQSPPPPPSALASASFDWPVAVSTSATQARPNALVGETAQTTTHDTHTIRLREQQPQEASNFKLEKIIQKCNVTLDDAIYVHLDGTRYIVIRTYARLSPKVFEEKIDVMCLPGDAYDFGAHPGQQFALLDCYACVKEQVERIGAASRSSDGVITPTFEITGFVLGVIGTMFTIVTGLLAVQRYWKRRKLSRAMLARNAVVSSVAEADASTDVDSVEEARN